MAEWHLLSEGWIAAAGATLGAILLKVAEKLLQQKKERFEQSLEAQAHADTRMQSLWARLDALQTERDALWERYHAAEEQHDARMREAAAKYQTLEKRFDELGERYRELRLIARTRNLTIPDEPPP